MPSNRYAHRRAKPISIDPRVVKAFLERKTLDDWRWLKEVPREELFKCIPEWFRFYTPPRLIQLVGTVIGISQPRFLFYYDMGGGKSKLLIDLIRYRKFEKTLRCALIGVPNVINLASWERQFEKHAPDLTYRILHGDKKSRYAMLDEALPDVCLINYGGLPVYMADARKKTKKGGTKRAMVVEDVQDFARLFNFLALDEIHQCGIDGTMRFDLLSALSSYADFAYGTTGTPMGFDPAAMWPQFNIIDRGDTLGGSLAMYRAAFCNAKEDYFAGWKYTFDARKQARFQRTIQHRSLRYIDSEFSDLPPVNRDRIMVDLSPAQHRRYEELRVAQIEAREREEREVIYNRARQTVAGFMSVAGDDSVKIQVGFEPNPKLQALQEWLRDLPTDEKVVVFHHYIYTGTLIRAMLDAEKIKYAGVGSGFKDAALQLRTFLTDKKCRVWLANAKAGGTGTDGLQEVARFGMFYETPDSPVVRKQCEKRLDRDGQERRVYIYDLVARGVNVDMRILKNVQLGIDFARKICDGRDSL